MLILASSSSQRRRLLSELGLEFKVIPSGIDEAEVVIGDPVERAKVLARLKAVNVSRRNPDSWVIGSDTLVVSSRGNSLEKPLDEEHAREMLKEQSGGVSSVHSAISLLTPSSGRYEGVSTALVRFRALSGEDIDWWISTGLWRDRSGSFQIEEEGQKLIENLEGDFSCVVGLPIPLLERLLKEAGFAEK